MTTIYAESADTGRKRVETATVGVLIALSASHMLNDVMQSLAPALYPVFRQEFALSFFQVGLITFVFQLTASFLQPVIGLSLDKRPLNWILPVGMAFTLVGLVLLAFASSYLLILLSVAVVGIGSAVFHPEASRVARAASGGRHGFAQSLFQVGGNFGQSLGPLLAAFIVVPFGQHSVLVFTLLALAAVIILTGVSRWYAAVRARPRVATVAAGPAHPRKIVVRTLFVLVVMLFSKVLYLASLNSYYTFYLIQTFGVQIQTAQVLLFVFLASVAGGHFPRWTAGRPFWREVRDLGLDPWRPALHAALAASRAHGHGDQFDRDRPHHLLGLLGDGRLRAGADAGQRRGGGGIVLRPVVRPGWRRRGPARHAGRLDEPQLRLSRLRLPAGGRPARRLPADRAGQGGGGEERRIVVLRSAQSASRRTFQRAAPVLCPSRPLRIGRRPRRPPAIKPAAPH